MHLQWKLAALLAVALLVTGLLAGCGGEKPVAKVNGIAITADSYMSEMEQFRPQDSPKSLGEVAMNRLVTDAVILSTAEKEKVAATDEQVNKDLDVARFQTPDLEAKLKQAGLTLEDYKKLSKTQISQMNLYTQKAKVSQKEIDAEYAKSKGLYPYTIPPSASWQMIAVSSEEEAKKVLAMLDKGANFGLVAQEKSMDPRSKARGGEMDPIPLTEVIPGMDPVMAKALKTLPIGKYSEPIDFQNAYLIIRVTNRSKPREMPRPLCEWLIRKDLLMRAASKSQKSPDEFVQNLTAKAQIDIYRDRVKDVMKPPTMAVPMPK